MDGIPSFLYGKFADVKRESSKVVSRLKKGMPIGEIVAGGEIIPIGSVPGKLILDGPNPLAGGEPNFNLFALPRLIMQADMPYERKYDAVMERFFEDMMQQFWGHMVLSCGQSVYGFYGSEASRVRYLQALIRFRENYLSINGYVDRLPMYGWNLQGEMSFHITEIFDSPQFIGKYVVGNLDPVRAKLPSEEINAILLSTHLFDLIEQWGLASYIEGWDGATAWEID